MKYEKHSGQLTKKRNATLSATSQNNTINPDIPKMSTHVLHEPLSTCSSAAEHRNNTHSQFLRAHHNVKRKNTPRARQAILLALVSNPHAIRQAPMSEDPRYPAGRVIHGMPPDMRVSPPSSAIRMVTE
jgi:hypothetical protein